MTDSAPRDGERTFVDAVIFDLPGGVIVIDDDGRVVHANRTARRILTGEDHPDPPLAGRLIEEICEPLEAMCRPAHKAEVVVPPLAEGDSARIIGFTSRPIVDTDALVVSFADITDQRAQEREDEHRRRLADLGKVVSSVAHEIRNPVFAISSLAQVLRDEERITDDADLLGVVEKIVAETGRIGRLVEDLLAFGRQRDLHLRRTDVVQEIEEALADLRKSLPPVGGIRIPLHLHVSSSVRGSPHWVTDTEAMRQIVVNLVRNGWRAVGMRPHVPRGGAVEVRLAHRREGDGGDPAWFEIAVVDNGIGIPTELRKQIFEAFYTRDPKGTGLGLAVVRRLMRQLGATLRLHSEVDRGTTFVVRLPADSGADGG